ncbi:hypothetical protein ACFX15_006737 [Malus domestica]
MIGRKSMGHASRVLLVLLAFGFFFATYNLLAIIIHKKASYLGILGADRLEDPVIQRPEKAENPKYHVALTATDAPHSQWQCRMMYYWYNKVKNMPGSDMGKFTRVLHSGNADNLMEEIPIAVVDPLPEGLDQVIIIFATLSQFSVLAI